MNELAEDRVFLRRAADDGERPDRAVAVVDAFDFEHGEVVCEAVVAEMVAKRAFGQQLVGNDRAADAEVGVGVNWQAIRAAEHTDAAAAECAGECELAHSFWQWQYGGEHHGGRSADENVDAERFAGTKGGGVVDAD
jgi:hypothetical protein